MSTLSQSNLFQIVREPGCNVKPEPVLRVEFWGDISLMRANAEIQTERLI